MSTLNQEMGKSQKCWLDGTLGVPKAASHLKQGYHQLMSTSAVALSSQALKTAKDGGTPLLSIDLSCISFLAIQAPYCSERT